MTISNTGFDPTWESLKNYTVPQWFRDAKFGIWAHWGPQAVPEVGDWYARHLYTPGHCHYDYHVKTYGHPTQVGYKDIIPLWKAEKFDPDHLMSLYKKAGARYFVALGVHHDNFDCWNSRHHAWNAMKMGPRKDIVGMWAQAARNQGLRFGVTEHLERAYSWFNTNKGSDEGGPHAGVPYDGHDPRYADLYFPPHADTSPYYPDNPPSWWARQWQQRVLDLVEQHRPDLLYTDGGIPFGQVGRELVADYYNMNAEWNDGNHEAVYALKNMGKHHGDYVDGVGVLDVERGSVDGIRDQPWQTDTCIGDWYYKRDARYKTAREVIHMLTDIVSKNGNLLLNLPLRGDGTLDEQALAVLQGITDWMAVNHEAIYETRPWRSFGEGPTQFGGGHFGEARQTAPTSDDFRFIRKNETLYAVAMGWPRDAWRIGSLAEVPIDRISLLGCDEPLRWSQDQTGVAIEAPTSRPCEHAFVFRMELAS